MRPHARRTAALAVVLLVLAACTGDTGETGADGAAAAAPTPGEAVGPPTPPAAGEMQLSERCDGEAGVTVAYPAGWHTGGAGEACERFHPEPLDDGAGPAGAAIRLTVEDVTREEAAATGAGQELARALATVAGQPAVRVMSLAGADGPLPAGTRSLTYLVDLSDVRGEPATLLATTSDAGELAFESNRLVLDAMMRGLELEGVAGAGEGTVVLASREGGVDVRVLGTLDAGGICLSAGGEPACGIPGLPPGGVAATTLAGSSPEVVAGTVARTADRVEVRRDGRVVTVLPVRLEGHAAWAAPVGGAGEIEVLALAADGAELGRVVVTATGGPGGP
jgi:hypothetical protein